MHFSLENSNVNSLSEIQKVMQQEQNKWGRGKVGMWLLIIEFGKTI